METGDHPFVREGRQEIQEVIQKHTTIWRQEREKSPQTDLTPRGWWGYVVAQKSSQENVSQGRPYQMLLRSQIKWEEFTTQFGNMEADNDLD